MGIAFGKSLKNQKNGNGVNMSDTGQGPKSGKVVENGFRMVASGCQGSPEVPVDLKRGLQTAPGPGEAARGQFRLKLAIRAAGGGVNFLIAQ